MTTATAAQAGGDEVSACTGLTALLPDVCVDGRAFTCACEPGDNLALHHALTLAPAGSVIVCDAGGDTSGGYFGELMSRDARAREIAGLVIVGSIRDVVQIRALGFPVFHHGTNPASCAKRKAPSVGDPVSIMGVRVCAGDGVVADPDGIVFVPAAIWPELKSRAQAVEEREAELVRELLAGTRLADLLDLLPE